MLRDSEIVARFWLHTRCHNCHHLTERTLDVPEADDAPRYEEDLIGSELLARLQFKCGRCENPIGSLVGLKTLPLDE
ncbi:MAG TPA: hypothetical protein VGU45_01510 [Microvirga sp.]|jgi:hypothetical protein|nr:hypothetical protein [Microvirga sp.]